MANETFTSGPWYVGDDVANDCPDHKNSGLALVDTGRMNDWPIARLCYWNNARLIAAAPDLLEVLESLLSLGRKDTSNPKYDSYYEAARAAIAKVTEVAS
jgi:hypothetical protein